MDKGDQALEQGEGKEERVEKQVRQVEDGVEVVGMSGLVLVPAKQQEGQAGEVEVQITVLEPEMIR